MSQSVAQAATSKPELFRQQITVQGNASGTFVVLDVSRFRALDVIFSVAFTGGTSPSCATNVLATDPYGNSDTIVGLTNNGITQSQGVGLGAQANHALGNKVSLTYAISGLPTSTTLSAYVVGIP